MTTQAVTAQVGGPSFSRTFSVTSTDGQFNNLISTLSSQAIGLEIPGRSINKVQVGQAAGVGVWRIMDGRTLVVRRWGLCYQNPYGCMMESSITPYVVKDADIFQVWTQPVAASNKSNAMGLLYTSSGIEAFTALAAVDATATAVTNLQTAQTLGDWAFGTTLSKVCFQLESGHDLHTVTIIDQTGGTVYTAYGNVRLPTAGGKSVLYNIEFPTSIKIMKGWTLKLTCESND